MSEIRFRLAKPSDAKQIAAVHWHVRDRYTEGIFLSLGLPFLRRYYRIILNDPYEVVICAYLPNGDIVGFSSATQDAKAQSARLKKHMLSLGLAASLQFVLHPKLIKEVWQRYKSIKGDSDAPKYVSLDGVRGEYWCWLKDKASGMESFKVDKIKYQVLGALGEKELFGEVDKKNTGVLSFHQKANKAEIIDEFRLPDGRERVVIRIPIK